MESRGTSSGGVSRSASKFARASLLLLAAAGYGDAAGSVKSTPGAAATAATTDQCNVAISARQDCMKYSADDCAAAGCCWAAHADDDHGTVPWCFSPTSSTDFYELQSGYVLDDSGLTGTLKSSDPTTDVLGEDIPTLSLKISFDDANQARVLIADAENPDRWTIPESIVPSTLDPATKAGGDRSYNLTFTESPFTFTLTRVSDGTVLFSSAPRLVFKDQYLELTTSLDAESSLFGIGESTRSDGLVLKPDTTYTLWAHDTPAMVFDQNLYASHPFFLELDKSTGGAHGAFLRNSNGMDVVYGNGGDALTYKVVGGVLDLFVFAGPSPAEVAAQYTALVGRPTMMPYWSLGFHQCKYGYENLAQVEQVQRNFSIAAIPLDTVWMDIDYMSNWKDWTYDPSNFPEAEVKTFVDGLHDGGQKFVVIVDPGILAVDPSWNLTDYTPYTDGLEQNLFVRDGFTGEPYMTQVWPGPTLMPDWLHPNTTSYWSKSIENFWDMVPFDGLWTDMNEVSNFCNAGGTGQVCVNANPDSCPTLDLSTQVDCCLSCRLEDGADKYDFPPYSINNNNAQSPLGDKTLPMSALHWNDADGDFTRKEYDVHNLFGLLEARMTAEALTDIRAERPFVLSRSTFASHGAHAAHWTGDNAATWQDLKASSVTVMNMGLFGIPMVGSDMCGFIYNTTEELCARWMALGAFHPFSRNHNTIGAAPQEPYLWDSVAAVSRAALGLRYRLLPYLYTLFHGAASEGALVAQALWVPFGADPQTHAVDEQFMLGESLLVSPALYEGQSTVSALFPAPAGKTATWYSLSASGGFGMEKVEVTTPGAGVKVNLATPLSAFNVHARSGAVLPLHAAADAATGSAPLTTAAARALPYELLVLLDATAGAAATATAAGRVFLDDGTQATLDKTTLVEYAAAASGDSAGSLTATLSGADGYPGAASATLATITVIGVTAAPGTAHIQLSGDKKKLKEGDADLPFTFEAEAMLLTIDLSAAAVAMNEEFVVAWK